MNKVLVNALLLTTLTISAYGYDATKAKNLEKFYSHMTQKVCADSKLFISAEDTLKLIRDNKKHVILDVRTAGENSVISVSDKNSIHIELKDLFKKENLDKISTDVPVIVVCHSGTRAVMAAMGLKQIGFKNIQVLKGGFIALAQQDTVKNAPIKP
jgi:rhodanese-related sulfurtransferase